jgi:hypothetical protein
MRLSKRLPESSDGRKHAHRRARGRQPPARAVRRAFVGTELLSLAAIGCRNGAFETTIVFVIRV